MKYVGTANNVITVLPGSLVSVYYYITIAQTAPFTQDLCIVSTHIKSYEFYALKKYESSMHL